MSAPYFAIASAYGIRRNGRGTSTPITVERRRQRAFDNLEDGLRPRKRHFEIHLGELELSIGALILVAEAARELHVAIHARDHQDLLEDLRRLRQREELAGVHAARHQKVARPFGGRLRQDRRLDLEKALLVEIVAERQRDVVAQRDVASAAGSGADPGSDT